MTKRKRSSSSPPSPPSPPSLFHPVLSLSFPRVLSLRSYLLEHTPTPRARRRIRQRANDALATVLDTTLVGLLDQKYSDSTLEAFRSRELSDYAESKARVTPLNMRQILDFALITLLTSAQYPRNILTQHVLLNYSPDPKPVEQIPNRHLSLLRNAPWSELPALLGPRPASAEVLLGLLLDCALFVFGGDDGALVQISGTPLPDLPILTPPPPPPSAPTTPPSKKPKPKPTPEVTPPNTILFVRRRMLYARAALNARGTVRFGLRHIHVLNRYPDASNPHHTLHICKHIFPRAFGLHNVFTSRVERGVTTARFMDYTMREGEIARQRKKDGKGQGKEKVPRRLRGVMPLVARLQRLHARCAYRELLERYCPIDGPLEGLSDSDALDSDLTRYATPAAAVSAFAQAVLRNILPHELFGERKDAHGHSSASPARNSGNLASLLRSVDHFIHARRFENISLHQVAQGIKVTSIPWLTTPGTSTSSTGNQNHVPSPADLTTRTALLHELLYYTLDSLLIPLLRANFYITESAPHRNALFYFRHDVWRRLAEPHVARLKTQIFQEVPTSRRQEDRDDTQTALARQSRAAVEEGSPLGYTLLRLLPKKRGARPVMNLRRRPMIATGTGTGAGTGEGERRLGPSINYLLKPLFEVLRYETQITPALLGRAAIANVTDMYPRLAAFREAAFRRQNGGSNGGDKAPRFYFVKLDVQSCFDTIPHEELLRLIREILPREEVYHAARYEEVVAAPRVGGGGGMSATGKKLRRRFCDAVASGEGYGGLYSGSGKRRRRTVGSLSLLSRSPGTSSSVTTRRRFNAVLVPRPLRRKYMSERLLSLLGTHIKNNLIRLGKKYYRQRAGIPQGSVVSSLLCNVFYAQHEREHLSFLTGEDDDDGALEKQGRAALFRMVDDYLLITTEKAAAVRFLDEMTVENGRFGIVVNRGKVLCNFACFVEGEEMPRLDEGRGGGQAFPFCGAYIDTRTLAVSKDGGNTAAAGGGGAAGAKDIARDIRDTLTVESTRNPGRAFFRKSLAQFKISITAKHAMFLDARHNGVRGVLRGLAWAAKEVAGKMVVYERVLGRLKGGKWGGIAGRKSKRRRGEGVSEEVFRRTVRAIVECAVHATLRHNGDGNATATFTDTDTDTSASTSATGALHPPQPAAAPAAAAAKSGETETDIAPSSPGLSARLIRYVMASAFLDSIQVRVDGAGPKSNGRGRVRWRWRSRDGEVVRWLERVKGAVRPRGREEGRLVEEVLSAWGR